jgi:hypothetical protein
MIRYFKYSISFVAILNLCLFFGVTLISKVSYAAPSTPESDYLVSACGQELNSSGDFVRPCNLNEFMLLIRKIIRFVVFSLTLPIAAIGFAVAGGMYITSAVSSKKSDAKRVLLYIVYGLLIVIAAWLIIEAIYRGLGYDAGVIIFN